jgi:hypothetical protein
MGGNTINAGNGYFPRNSSCKVAGYPRGRPGGNGPLPGRVGSCSTPCAALVASMCRRIACSTHAEKVRYSLRDSQKASLASLMRSQEMLTVIFWVRTDGFSGITGFVTIAGVGGVEGCSDTGRGTAGWRPLSADVRGCRGRGLPYSDLVEVRPRSLHYLPGLLVLFVTITCVAGITGIAGVIGRRDTESWVLMSRASAKTKQHCSALAP